MSPLECDLQVINSDAKILITAKERFKNMNSGIYLVVETPRAGRLGHRFIRSSNVLPTEQSIVDIFTKTGMNPVGANYISVSMPMTQTLPGSVRQGNEKIVLIGVNTQKVDIVKIEAALQKLFVPLDQLIKDTDWEKESNKIICFNPILEGWISTKDFQDLPEYKSEDPKPPPSVLSENIKKLLLIIIVILFVGGGVWLSQNFPPLRKKSDPSVDNKSTEQYLSRLMIEFDCKEEVDKFKKEMKSYVEATSPKYEEIKLEEYAKSFFDEKNKLKSEKYAFILNNSKEGLEFYYKEIIKFDCSKLIQLRQNIYKCVKTYINMCDFVKNNGKLKVLLEEIQFNKKFIIINTESKINFDWYEPRTPLFNEQDKKALQCFGEWIQKNKDCLNIKNAEEDFSAYIKEVNGKKDIIDKSFDDKIKELNNNPTNDNKKLAEFYTLVKKFIISLCELAPPL